MSQALGTLVRDTTIKTTPLLALTDGGTLIKSRSHHFIRDTDAGDGPFLIGVCVGGLSISEISGYYTLNGPQGMEHTDVTESVTRGQHIRTLGFINPDDNKDGGTIAKEFISVTKMGFTEDDAGYDYFLMNLGNDLVTGSTWEIQHEDFVIWD